MCSTTATRSSRGSPAAGSSAGSSCAATPDISRIWALDPDGDAYGTPEYAGSPSDISSLLKMLSPTDDPHK